MLGATWGSEKMYVNDTEGHCRQFQLEGTSSHVAAPGDWNRGLFLEADVFRAMVIAVRSITLAV